MENDTAAAAGGGPTLLMGIDAVQQQRGISGGSAANGVGWIGLGLSEAGGMKGSDLWVVAPTADLAPFMSGNQVRGTLWYILRGERGHGRFREERSWHDARPQT